MEVIVEVAPHVFRYLATEFGPGPYRLEKLKHRDIRAALLYGELWADAHAPALEIPQAHWVVYLYIDQPLLADLFRLHKGGVMRRYTIFVKEFWDAAIGYVQGFIDAQAAAGRTEDRKAALASFLARYNISEDILSLDSAYRQYYRLLLFRQQSREVFVQE